MFHTALRDGADRLHRMNGFFHDIDSFFDREVVNRLQGVISKNLKESYELTVEVPGLGREDLDVTVEQGVISINGKKGEKEVSHAFTLPDDAGQDIEAKIENGLLTLVIQKRKETLPKKITVR